MLGAVQMLRYKFNFYPLLLSMQYHLIECSTFFTVLTPKTRILVLKGLQSSFSLCVLVLLGGAAFYPRILHDDVDGDGHLLGSDIQSMA